MTVRNGEQILLNLIIPLGLLTVHTLPAKVVVWKGTNVKEFSVPETVSELTVNCVLHLNCIFADAVLTESEPPSTSSSPPSSVPAIVIDG